MKYKAREGSPVLFYPVGDRRIAVGDGAKDCTIVHPDGREEKIKAANQADLKRMYAEGWCWNGGPLIVIDEATQGKAQDEKTNLTEPEG